MQAPDTHLHQPFSKLYLGVEQAKLHHNTRGAARMRIKRQRAKIVQLFIRVRHRKLRQAREARDLELLKFGDGLEYMARGFVAERIKCLDQVHLRSPPLPLAVEAHWEQRKLAFANNCCFWYKDATGTTFLNLINLLIAELGVHYEGPHGC